MVATGQSRLLPAPVTERVTARVTAVAADQPVARVGLAMAVDRSGRQITVVRGLDDGRHLVEGPDGPDASPEGRIPDACRRGLGLPTPPPGSEVIELWAFGLARPACCFDAVAEPRARTWVEAAGRFPASGHPPGTMRAAPATPDAQITTRLVRRRGRVAARGRWGELRRRWGRWSGVRLGVDRHTASWMDDGMFSREVLGGVSPLMR